MCSAVRFLDEDIQVQDGYDLIQRMNQWHCPTMVQAPVPGPKSEVL